LLNEAGIENPEDYISSPPGMGAFLIVRAPDGAIERLISHLQEKFTKNISIEGIRSAMYQQ
jgi:hypothetical protein